MGRDGQWGLKLTAFWPRAGPCWICVSLAVRCACTVLLEVSRRNGDSSQTPHLLPPSPCHLDILLLPPASPELGLAAGTATADQQVRVRGRGTGPPSMKPPSVQLSGVSQGLGQGQHYSVQGTAWQTGLSVEAENSGVLGHLRGLSSHLPGQDRGGCQQPVISECLFLTSCLTLTEGPGNWEDTAYWGWGRSQTNHCHSVGCSGQGMPKE